MKHNSFHLFLFSILVIAFLFAVPTERVQAEPEGSPNSQPGVADETCLACHGEPDMQTTLPSGEILYLTIDRLAHQTSVHGQLGYACVQCHTDITSYPHPENSAQTLREYKLEQYTLCKRCHIQNYENTLDSTHQQALAAGNLEAAVCTDCHGAHNIGAPSVPRSNIPRMCQQCHSEIYNLYKESVHGSALIGAGNPDVPTCTDCHGVHDISGPSTGPFHLFSPQICAECHADDDLMERYGVSTHVFETYISDFHGTTVVLFEKTAPDQETNKPVCVDCHGVHDMKMVDDPESRVIRENLLGTCQKCHPDATSSFPPSWLGHYVPSPEKNPLVFFVNLFYQVLIPTTVGGMIVFVVVDAGYKIFKRRERRK